jgi:hypothetical protein
MFFIAQKLTLKVKYIKNKLKVSPLHAILLILHTLFEEKTFADIRVKVEQVSLYNVFHIPSGAYC